MREVDKAEFLEFSENSLAFLDAVLSGLDDVNQFLHENALCLDDGELPLEFPERTSHLVAALRRPALLKQLLEPAQDQEHCADCDPPLPRAHD